MLQGLYAAASGMEAQQNQFNAISNDLSNLNTPGYQATEVGFQDLLYSGAGSASGTTMATGTGASSSIIGRSQVEGALERDAAGDRRVGGYLLVHGASRSVRVVSRPWRRFRG